MSGDPREPAATAPAPGGADALGVDRRMLERAIGGWRGMIDSGVPTVVFVIAYVVTSPEPAPIGDRRHRRRAAHRHLAGDPPRVPAAGAAPASSGWHLRLRREHDRQGGELLPAGILQNLGYGLAFLISILVRWPLLGIVIGYLTGEGTTWRPDTAAASHLRGRLVDLGGPVRPAPGRPGADVPRRRGRRCWAVIKIVMGVRCSCSRAYLAPDPLPACSRRPMPRRAHAEPAAGQEPVTPPTRRRSLRRDRAALERRLLVGCGDEEQLVTGLERVVRGRRDHARVRGRSRRARCRWARSDVADALADDGGVGRAA